MQDDIRLRVQDDARLGAAKVQDNLLAVLWMLELHPGLEIVELHVG